MTKFYITTSIPYTNAYPHVGFALESIQADVLARYHRAKGDDVFFLTGTDEHGIKIERASKDAVVSPQQFVDTIVQRFQELTKILNISNTDFIRTSDQKKHWPSVKIVWEKLVANGDIYKKQYKGWYCVGCEAFITEKDLVDGLCLIHKKKPEEVEEENYFFKLSKYASKIEKLLRSNSVRIIPENKKNEFLELIKQGLEDISFSRSREKLSWGIPVPGDDSQIIYVWSDALVNYISALGYPSGVLLEKFWPADIHVVGKDIAKFHVLYWPAMLLSLGLDLPKTIFVHGFITVGGQKMSKTIGNVIDPFPLIEKYGADAVRYFLLREIPSTEDGDFTQEKFEERYNADLASGLGNLVARVLAMAEKAGVSLPKSINNKELGIFLAKTKTEVSSALDEFQFGKALEHIWGVIQFCDKYIDEKKPWVESGNQKEVLGDLLYALEGIGNLLVPFLPEASEKIKAQLSGRERAPLFPRLLSN